MANFTLYIKRKGGSSDSATQAVALLKTHLSTIEQKKFDSMDAMLVESDATPSLSDTDVIVYLVRDVHHSVIAKNGSNNDAAIADGNLLGLTDLNSKICEVYFDRLYDGSAKELSGACFHEAAHILSNMDNSMHNGQDGFLKGKPDYYGSPSKANKEFFAKHVGRKVSMRGGL
jgi:hypothetical protein